GRARSLTALGRHPEALAEWDRALALTDATDRARIRAGRAIAVARAGDRSRALAEAEELAGTPDHDGETRVDIAPAPPPPGRRAPGRCGPGPPCQPGSPIGWSRLSAPRSSPATATSTTWPATAISRRSGLAARSLPCGSIRPSRPTPSPPELTRQDRSKSVGVLPLPLRSSHAKSLPRLKIPAAPPP